MKQKIKMFLNRIKGTNKKTYLILGIILIICFGFYWWQIRPSHVKSICSEVSFLRAKSYQYDTDLWDLYLSSTSSPTYKGFNVFLKKKYENDKNFLLQEYDTSDYNSEYSRCLHEYGL